MTAAVDTTAKAGALWSTRIDDIPVSLSAAAGRIAVAGAEGTAWVLDAATGEPTATVSLPGGALHATLSPDGTRLVVTGLCGYGLYDTATAAALLLVDGGWCSTARWADTDRFAVASGRVANVVGADGRALWMTAPAPSTVTDLAWLRDGRRLAASAYNGVYCYEQHQSEPVMHYPYLGSHLALAIPSTGRWITAGNQDASIHIWRTRDAEELTMSGYPDKVARLAFDDTGRWLANDGAPDVSVWDFAGKGPAGSTPRTLRLHETITALAWQPGGNAILASAGDDGAIALWNPAAGRPGRSRKPTRIWNLDDAVTALTWPTAARLVAADRSGAVTVFEV